MSDLGNNEALNQHLHGDGEAVVEISGETISQAMDCDKWPEWLCVIVNSVTDNDDQMSTEQAVALGVLLSRRSEPSEPVTVTFARNLEAAQTATEPEFVEAISKNRAKLYLSPSPTQKEEVTVTDEMVEAALEAFSGAERSHYDAAMRYALNAALRVKP